jgi:four helix bundle protein
MANDEKPYDLEERTALFGESIIGFAKSIPVNPVTNRLINQLVGAGTSVGANYCEADDAVSKKDSGIRYRFRSARRGKQSSF